MNHVPVIPQTARTWRDTLATEPARPRPLNRTGRRRMVVDSMRLWLSVLAVGASLVTGYAVWGIWHTNPATLAAPTKSAPLREIAVRTDGVLDRAWVERTLGIAPGTGLMELDLPSLRERLLVSGQVRMAVVTRRFPDVLGVTLEERSPVLRLRAQSAEGEEFPLYVSRDGIVFRGEHYPDELATGLPWLGGVTLTRVPEGTGFAPVEGLDAVADLLGTARASAPSLAKDFQVVSLARYARDGIISVRTPQVAEIMFAAHADFFRQIAKLDYIVEEARGRAMTQVNLAVGGHQVPVTFAPEPDPEPTPAGRTGRPAATPARAAPRTAERLPRTFTVTL